MHSTAEISHPRGGGEGKKLVAADVCVALRRGKMSVFRKRVVNKQAEACPETGIGLFF